MSDPEAAPAQSRPDDPMFGETNPNYEQFDCRQVPFAGDYLYVSSLTPSTAPTRARYPRTRTRRPRTSSRGRPLSGGLWRGDLCPRAGGLDQNIYGDFTP